MSFQAPKCLTRVVFFALIICMTFPAQAQKPDLFAGVWVDQKNPALQILVTKVNGIYKVNGGDGSFGYDLACLKNKMTSVCTGYGGLLEGKNFLYQNTLQFRPNGVIFESWKAFNNLQTIKGETIWKRK